MEESLDPTTIPHRVKPFILALLSLCLLGAIGCSSGAQFQKPIEGQPTVVFLGDSITYNWNQSWAGPTFTEHPTWIDAGVTGDSSCGMAARFRQDVVDRHPQMVAILAGTNDVYPGWVLCGSADGATNT